MWSEICDLITFDDETKKKTDSEKNNNKVVYMKLNKIQLILLYIMIGMAGLCGGRMTVIDGFFYGVLTFLFISFLPLVYLWLIWENQNTNKK